MKQNLEFLAEHPCMAAKGRDLCLNVSELLELIQ